MSISQPSDKENGMSHYQLEIVQLNSQIDKELTKIEKQLRKHIEQLSRMQILIETENAMIRMWKFEEDEGLDSLQAA